MLIFRSGSNVFIVIMKKVFLSLLFFHLVYFLFSKQDYISFDRITTRDGLSQNTVFSIIQDSKGLLWIGTYDGLNKYDGKTFTTYRNDKNDENSLSNNMAFRILEDSSGFLWIGTLRGGLNRYNPSTDSFFSFKNDPLDPSSISSNRILSLYEDKEGTLWVGTANGLNKYNVETNNFVRFTYDENDTSSINLGEVWAIHEDKSGDFWICTLGGGLNKLDKENNIFTHYTHDPNDNKSLSDDWVKTIFEDHEGQIWIGTDNGLNKFNKKKDSFIRFLHDRNNPNSISNNEIRSIAEDSEGNLWIGTRKGLNVFKQEKGFDYFFHDPANYYSLNSNNIWTLYRDRTGLLWVGTTLGVTKINNNYLFKLLQTYNGLSSNYIRSIYEDRNGYIWVGTVGGGLNRVDPQDNTIKHFFINPDILGSNKVRGICEDLKGNLWFGTIKGGLNMLDSNTNRFITYKDRKDKKNSISSNSICSLFIDSSGLIWIGTFTNGLDCFDPVSKIFTNYSHKPNDFSSLSRNKVTAIYEDRERILWIGTEGGGLNRKENDSFVHFRHSPNNSTSISSDNILAIIGDKEDNIWIGTEGDGLNKYDKITGSFSYYNTNNGLANDYINGIIEDTNGNIWVSTNKGISKINIISGKITNYDVFDGLQDFEFNISAFCKTSSGEVYFGGVNGISHFFPEKIRENSSIPLVSFISITQNGDEFLEDKNLENFRSITLNWNNNHLEFEFAALNYINSHKNQFAYKLEGFDTNWNYPGNRGYGKYTNIPAGKYSLKVKAANSDGVWNEEGRSVIIEIIPPPWKRWWAYCLYVFMGVVLWLILFYYLKKREKEKLLRQEKDRDIKHYQELAKQEEEFRKQKTDFFVNLAHEIKTPLMLINNYLDGYIKDVGIGRKLQVIKKNMDKLSKDIVNFLDVEKNLNEQITYDHTSIICLSNLLHNKIILCKETALKKRVILEYDADEKIYCQADPVAIERLFNNLIENGIKYTPEWGKIKVNLAQDESRVLFSIRNDGPGIQADKQEHIFKPFYQLSHKKENNQGIGMGLYITKSIIDSLDGTIEVESIPGESTIFSVYLKAYFLKENDIVYKDLTFSDPEDSSFIHKDDFSREFKPGLPTVFFIEDNRDLAYYYYTELKESYNIFHAENGAAALEDLEYFCKQADTENISKPDLIISDIMMDKMDGFEFLARLKESNDFNDLPLIFLTAKTEVGEKIKGLAEGAIDYITKPANLSEIKLRISSILENRFAYGNKIKAERIYKPDEIKLVQHGFTEREKEVTRLLFKGYPSSKIMEALSIKKDTEKTHRKNIFKKAEVHSVEELKYKLQ